MTTMPWFRLYSEVLHDRKIRKICQLCKQPKAVVLGVWVTLLAIASESPERGRLLIGEDLPLDLDDLADETGLPLPELDAIMSSFKQMGMVLETGHIGKWDQRQFQSDNSTLRVRKHRAKLAEKDMKRDETLQKRSSIVIDSDTESDTDKKKKQKKNAAATAAAPPTPPPTTNHRPTPEALVFQIASLPSIPPGQAERIEQIEAMLDTHPPEKVKAALVQGFTRWIGSKSKNGKPYARTNLGWVDWAVEILAGGTLTPQKSEKEMTDAEWRAHHFGAEEAC